MQIKSILSNMNALYPDADVTCLYPNIVFFPVDFSLKKYISYSEIECFLNCKIKYLMHYVLNIRMFQLNVSAFIGTVLHSYICDVVNMYFHESFHDVFDDRQFLHVARNVFNKYHKIFQRDLYRDDIDYVRNVIHNFYKSKVIKFDLVFSDVESVKIFLNSGNMFDNFIVKKTIKNLLFMVIKLFKSINEKNPLSKALIECEKPIRFPLKHTDFYGVIDLLLLYDNIGYIIDYKFGRSEYVDFHQLLYYSAAFNVHIVKYLIFPSEMRIKRNVSFFEKSLIIDRLFSFESMIKDFILFYNDHREVIRREYKILENSFNQSSLDADLYFPFIALYNILRIVYLFLCQYDVKILKKDADKLCPFCEYYMYCQYSHTNT